MLASLVAELLPVQIAEQPSELDGVFYTPKSVAEHPCIS